MSKPFIVGIGGTTRPGSSTERALRYTLAAAEDLGATTQAFYGDHLAALPHYAPEKPERTQGAVDLVDAVRKADGLVIASSSYHGTISGLVKNALDYTEDLGKDDRPYFADRAVGLIATGGGWQGVVVTLDHLRAMTHALRGWPTPLGAALNTATPAFDADGQPVDERTAFVLRTVAEEVVSFARWCLAAR